MKASAIVGSVLLVATVGLAGCQSVYYGTMEKLGVHKRDILVDRVKDARDEQQAAKEQFESALEQFQAVVKVEAGDLEKTYRDLKRELDRSETRAKAVHDRIESIEQVSAALFAEWEKEISEYSSGDLRRKSEQKLAETRRRYDGLLTAMKQVERKMEPVLVAFRDQVLYLKHNLNAKAVASLQGEVVTLENEVAELVREMEQAIAQADAFVQSMETE
jgi:SMC interacting uncharacterized protein involved in chromosome segregation